MIITPRVCSAWESQVHSSICCCWDEQWFSPSAHFCTDQLLAAVCHPFHDEPKHIYWAPPRHHGPEHGCCTSPAKAGVSSTGCRENCSVHSWPHAAATTAPRREQEISFLNIKPSATFLITLPTRRLIPAALSPGCWWKPLVYFWCVTKQLQSSVQGEIF